MQDTATPQPDTRTDAELLGAIATQRDAGALSEILRRYDRQAFALALHITGNRTAAEETVQEAMIRVWKSARSYKAKGPVKAWLMCIVGRESMRVIETMKRTAASMETDEHYAAGAATSPEADAENSELTEALRHEFQRLPEIERQIIGLHFGGGLSQQEISAALSIPQQTISYRLNTILKTLRTNLAAAGFAAIAPALVGEALRSGYEAPAGIRARVLSSLPDAKSARLNQSRRVTTAKSSSLGIAVAGAALAAIAAVGVWLAGSRPAPVAPAPATPPAAAAPAADDIPVSQRLMRQPPDWHRRWTFEHGVPPDLERINNTSWTWNRDTQALEISKEASFFPHYLLPKGPLRFTLKGKGIDAREDVYSGARLYNGGLVKPRQTWKKQSHLATIEVESHIYLYENRVVMDMNGDPGLVVEYPVSFENDAIVFNLQNFALHEIIATPVSENELPEYVKHPESITKTMELVKE